jgi:hypothetical protein
MSPDIALPVYRRNPDLLPLPIYYSNAERSFFGVMLFPDDLTTACRFLRACCTFAAACSPRLIVAAE